ncbi:MAG TPA: enediyne antibiotic chromoprotein [Pilimelia sp.]|nr:enediyne antibiotic chromoprotein [Pilimelia sp.]
MTRNKTTLLAKLGLAVALASGLTAAAFQSPAFADGHTIAVTPSADLSDGDVVSVSITGGAASATYFTAQCGEITPETFVCSSDVSPVDTDENGSAQIPLTVRRSFDAVGPDGTPWGTVTCGDVQCYIAAGNDSGWDGTPISFK